MSNRGDLIMDMVVGGIWTEYLAEPTRTSGICSACCFGECVTTDQHETINLSRIRT